MKMRVLVARNLIGIVIFLNIQAAMAFLISPSSYASGFEVSGIPGDALVRGMGILFIMWNIPYFVALANPVRYKVSLFEAIAMQAVGVVGESILLATLPEGHPALRLTAARFIIFDGAGLLLLIIAAILAMRNSKTPLLQHSIE